MSDALINGLAGAGGGIIAQLITYPLQTVICLFNSSGSLIFYIRIFLDIYIYIVVVRLIRGNKLRGILRRRKGNLGQLNK